VPAAPLTDAVNELPAFRYTEYTSFMSVPCVRLPATGDADSGTPGMSLSLGVTPTALATSSRPPVTHLPARPATASTLLSTRFLRWAMVSPGNTAAHSATAPVTCGAAIDVPCQDA